MRASRGFTLVEIAVVLVIVTFLIAMAAAIVRPLGAQQRRSATLARMQLVDAALIQFVGLQKRLPCPADGTIIDPTNPSYGFESARNAAGCTTNEANGILPWRTLGLSEPDVTDGWDRRFTYRIAPSLGGNNALDMSMCDTVSSNNPNTPVAACDPTCTAATPAQCTPPQSFLINKGLEVRKVDNVTKVMDPAAIPPTGAAYVLISHGETGGGGLTSAGIGTARAEDSPPEQMNYGTQPLAGYYISDDFLETPHFDDMVSRPSLGSVIGRASLGHRTHP